MVRTSRARAVSSGGGLSPTVVAVGAVLIVVAAAGVLYFLGTNQRTEPRQAAIQDQLAALTQRLDDLTATH